MFDKRKMSLASNLEQLVQKGKQRFNQISFERFFALFNSIENSFNRRKSIVHQNENHIFYFLFK